MYLNNLREYNSLLISTIEKIRNNNHSKSNLSMLDICSVYDIEELINELNNYLHYKEPNIFFSFNKNYSNIEIKAQTNLAIETIRYISIKELVTLSHHYKKNLGIILDASC